MKFEGWSIGVLEYPHCVNKKLWSIRNLEAVWRAGGARVIQYSDLSQPVPEVDIWFCHLDSTIMPKDFSQFIDSQPKVVNGELKDIRKTSFSEQLLDSANSSYEGAVIVKSDYNYGGLVDMRMADYQRGFMRLLPKRIRKKHLGLPSDLEANSNYIVYDSLQLVPPECFQNQHTVVEKFLPEKDGVNYALRMTFKLGCSVSSYRIISTEQIVKNKNEIGRAHV